MYHRASGYQQYLTQVNHDETAQAYGGASHPLASSNIYIDPMNRNHSSHFAQDSFYLSPRQQHPAQAAYDPHAMASSVDMDRASVHAVPPPAPPVDPAFSNDPRANPANPYAHYTSYRMDSREEIIPLAAGPSYDSFYGAQQQHDTSYHRRDPIPPSSREQRRDISSIYGPPVGTISNSRPLSDVSHYSHSLYTAPSVHDRRASVASSIGSIRLPYDAPEAHPPVIPVPPPMNHSASSMSNSKLHRKHRSMDQHEHHNHSSGSVYAAPAAASSFSSSSSSFVHVHKQSGKSSTSLASYPNAQSRSSLYVANPSSESDTYAVFRPPPGSPYSSNSSQSSASAPEEPTTPPQTASDKGYISSSTSSKKSKHSHSSKKVPDIDKEKLNDIIHVSAAEDFPPAYTPLPAQNETVTAASSPASDSKEDVRIVMFPDGITVRSSTGKTPLSGPSQERSPPQEQSSIAMPIPHSNTAQHSPPRETAVVSMPQPSSSASGPSQASVQAPAEIKKSKSGKPAVSTPPKDLDKIDELDETDPLGFAWHHHGPYEAIIKATKGFGEQDTGAHQQSGGPKIFAAMSGAQPQRGPGESKKSRRQPPPVDPSITSFRVKPGELFPPILPPQQLPLPPGIIPTPMSPQAPMSPLQKQSFMNAHMRPVGKHEPVPPPFSPTPSQMERARNPQHRMSMMSQVTNADLQAYSELRQPLPSSFAQRHPHSQSQASQMSHNSHSSPPSSSSASSSSVPRVSPPQFAPTGNLKEVAHRPQPVPVQPPQQPQAQLYRANSYPLPAQPAQHQKPLSAPHVLSADPPPTPDIRLPPPSVHTRSIAPSSANSHSSRQPHPHYLPKRLVMPTPLQPMQPPQQGPVSAQAPSYSVHGENSYSGLKRGVTVGATPKAQDIPMSAAVRKLKKQKEARGKDKEFERDIEELERQEREKEAEREKERQRERERRRARSASVSAPPSHASNATVFASEVVVPVIEPTKSIANGGGGGWGFGLFSSGEKEKLREKELEKEKGKERKKLSKRR
ncbi:hypothetical protein BC835DRAFT_1516541 [Cytidiella melzeri]|nr:hypothetical protein BC835DRAFT_1516541 [Cytidiella melzeri]